MTAEELKQMLSLHYTVGPLTTIDDMQRAVPEGWRQMPWWHTVEAFRRQFPDFHLHAIRLHLGLLRFDGTGDTITAYMFNAIAQKIAKDSATVCMRCGKVGYRRKFEDGYPCLCADDYVWYVNSLDKQQLL